jgi:hypothetical protein
LVDTLFANAPYDASRFDQNYLSKAGGFMTASASIFITACPKTHPTQRRAFLRCVTGISRPQDTMSNKIDFITYLKSTLTAASSKLQSAQPPDLDTARRLDQIVRTAEDISTGHWARIAVDIHGNHIGNRFASSNFNGVASDPEDPPTFESQAAYLKRHGLFLDGEERRLKKADWEAEAILTME